MSWYLESLKKYVVFSGRARRKEYWMFMLFYTLILVALVVVDLISGLGFLTTIFCLAMLLPSLAVSVRRLHDTSRSGWWLLVNFVPVVGGIIFLIFMVQDGKGDMNDYGQNPKTDWV